MQPLPFYFSKTTRDIMTNLLIGGDKNFLSCFHELLEEGFRIKCTVGVSIASLLTEQYGLSLNYIEKQITTIFLNGKPVDNITSSIIQSGANLALSGAMPGLVGATLRTKSPLASLRETITFHKNGMQPKKTKGFIRIKLFNVLIKKLGPLFLKKGIVVSSKRLQHFLLSRESQFWKGCKNIIIDGTYMDTDNFRKKGFLAFKTSQIYLIVSLEEG